MRPGAIQNPDATRAGAVDIALHVDFHAVRVAWPITGHGTENAVCGQSQQACRFHVKGPNVPTAGVVDVEDALIRRKAQAIGQDAISHQEVNRLSVRRDAIDATKVQLGFDTAQPRIGKVDAAV